MSEATFERGYNAFKENIDAPIAAYFQSCVHCGMCAEACLFFTETNDPKYTPIHKLEPMRKVWEQEYTLWGKLLSMVGLNRKLTDEDLTEWEELLYNTCTLCGRCSMVCPVGNDIVYMIRKAREGMAAAGHAPKGQVGAAKRAITIGSPMGVKLPALQAQIRHIEKDTGMTIPMDLQDADYMILMSSMEIMNFPEYLEAVARIMQQAGKTWTIASNAFEGTNTGIQMGASDIARELVGRIVKAAEELNVKTVVSPECGHAYTAIRWEGPNLMGKKFGFKVQHILEVLDDLRDQGLLKTEGMEEDRLTFHDPCQLVRKGGVVEQPRRLMKMVAKNFVEMPDAGMMNWCCGGGGGANAIEEGHALRTKVFQIKLDQFDAVKPDRLVTACANCRIMIEEGFDEYERELPVIGLTELVAEHLVEKP